MIEALARIPTEVDLGSEFRYRDPIVGSHDLLLAISQSGETTDTLAAFREGKRKGMRSLSICNVVDSSLARDSEGVFYTHAGPEIGVASTKAFTTQLVGLFLLALHLAETQRDHRPPAGERAAGGIVKIAAPCAADPGTPPPDRKTLQKIHERPGFPVPGPGDQLPHRPGGCAEAHLATSGG